jgi:hypothetical protein
MLLCLSDTYRDNLKMAFEDELIGMKKVVGG